MYPRVQEIPYSDPVDLFAKVKDRSVAILLDSALTTVAWARYSYIAFDPWRIMRSTADDPLTLEQLRLEYEQYSLDTYADFPPFQGGMAGYFSY